MCWVEIYMWLGGDGGTGRLTRRRGFSRRRWRRAAYGRN